MHSHTVSKPPLSLCVSVCVCLRADAAAFPRGLSEYSFQFNARTLPFVAVPPTILSNISPPTLDPSSVSVGAEEDAGSRV